MHFVLHTQPYYLKSLSLDHPNYEKIKKEIEELSAAERAEDKVPDGDLYYKIIEDSKRLSEALTKKDDILSNEIYALLDAEIRIALIRREKSFGPQGGPLFPGFNDLSHALLREFEDDKVEDYHQPERVCQAFEKYIPDYKNIVKVLGMKFHTSNEREPVLVM